MLWRVDLMLFSALLVYLLVGALVFYVIEYEETTPSEITAMTFFKDFLATYPNVSESALKEFASQVTSAYSDGAVVGNATESGNGWSYDSAVYFCVTVITTVGYGNISPTTRGGKIFCLFYALIGIPLTATLLAGVGRVLHKPLTLLHNARPWYSGNKLKDKLLKSAVVVFFGTAFMLCVPAAIFTVTEDWDYVTAIYYSTITLTTVGFGDYVAGQGSGADHKALYRALMSVWLVVGLSWVALCFSAASDFLSKDGNKTETDETEATGEVKEKNHVNGQKALGAYGAGRNSDFIDDMRDQAFS